LKINSMAVGSVSGRELEKGINLTTYGIGPIAAQGKEILAAVVAKEAIVGQWRGMSQKAHAAGLPPELKEPNCSSLAIWLGWKRLFSNGLPPGIQNQRRRPGRCASATIPRWWPGGTWKSTAKCSTVPLDFFFGHPGSYWAKDRVIDPTPELP